MAKKELVTKLVLELPEPTEQVEAVKSHYRDYLIQNFQVQQLPL